jgi:2-keto-4-pentenoate hydratase/2-oxohepta-3-ene-1,7-dioic acid hydratase in catechol pathway
MQLSTIRASGAETTAAVVDPAYGMIDVSSLLGEVHRDAGSVIRAGVSGSRLAEALSSVSPRRFRDPGEAVFLAPVQEPGMIWGIGLNYREHAADLSERAPQEAPASFIKGSHTLIGSGDPIPIPWQSERTTAEAELGLVFGRRARNLSNDEAMSAIWGVVPILDQTAEDLLQRNPRYLTLSKNFPGFLSCGPGIVPLCELDNRAGDIDDVVVQTVINGVLHRENRVSNMTFRPRDLIAFHTQLFEFKPGDIISTGTPGAVEIKPADTVECRIVGVGSLQNPVTSGPPIPP